jgi:predicted nucleic acid-binding protein
MNDRTFVDTNVLIYAHDVDSKEKHTVAKETLSALWANRTGVLSTQVLQELYVDVTKKLSKPLSKRFARAVVDKYAVWCLDATPAGIQIVNPFARLQSK